MNNEQQQPEQNIAALQLEIQELKASLSRCKDAGNAASEGEAVPAERIYNTEFESYKQGTWGLNPDTHGWVSRHDCEHKLFTQSISATKNRHLALSGGHFKSNEINKNVKLNIQASKEDKLLSESEQQSLDLARIGLLIEDMSREFSQIDNPTESETKTFLEAIYGISQDLVRLGFSYAHKWKNNRSVCISQAAGYDKDTAVSVPESNSPEFQHLFSKDDMERMEKLRQDGRQDRLIKQALSNKTGTNYSRKPYQQTQNNRGSFGSFGSRFNGQQKWNRSSKWNIKYSGSSYKQPSSSGFGYNSTEKTKKGSNSFNQSSQGTSIFGPSPTHKMYGEKEITYFAIKNKRSKGSNISTARIPNASPLFNAPQKNGPLYGHKLHGARIRNTWDYSKSKLLRHNLRVTNIFKRRHKENTTAFRHDPHKRVHNKRKLQNGRCEVFKRLNNARGLHRKIGRKIGLSPRITQPRFHKNVQIHAPKHGVRIPATTIWTKNCTESVFKNNENSHRTAKNDRNSSCILYRRHRYPRYVRCRVPPPHKNYPETLGKFRTFLVFLFDTAKISIHLTQERTKKIRREVRRARHQQLTTRQAMGINGLFSAAATAIGTAAIKSRELQMDISKALTKPHYWYDSHCPLSENTIKDLIWWEEQINVWNSSPMMLKPVDPNAPVSATADASETG
ncbi:hypothetical protein AYI69_g10365 [Smittium culicis]|uniref:Uncharacterized protein n=1 Tax=Smittium culicis TaxID=133412 RepID=A0A1R1X670_9FUNG|nr:hypothetical protein AYI69_g10365 [Smittium culicis]